MGDEETASHSPSATYICCAGQCKPFQDPYLPGGLQDPCGLSLLCCPWGQGLGSGFKTETKLTNPRASEVQHLPLPDAC